MENWPRQIGTCSQLEVVGSLFYGLMFLNQRLSGDEMRSFSFLTESRVLLATILGPRLLVVDFNEPSDEESPMHRYICSFNFPNMNIWTSPLHITIRSDPAPSWTPNPQLQALFSHENNDRLFVVTLWTSDGLVVKNVVLFIPASTLLTHLSHANAVGTDDLLWEAWGPEGTRMLPSLNHSNVWVCYVYGSKFVVSRPPVQAGVYPVDVYDFHQLSFRRSFQQTVESSARTNTEFVAGGTRISNTFRKEIRTCLPYRKRTIYLNNRSEIESVMCNEDNLIFVSVSFSFLFILAPK